MELVAHSVHSDRSSAFNTAFRIGEAFESKYGGLDWEFKNLKSRIGVWEVHLTHHFVVVCPWDVFNLIYEHPTPCSRA